MNQIISFVLSYVLVLAIGFFLINFMSGGFFATFIRVKASRGRLTLIELNGISNTVFKAGKITNGNRLRWKTGKKEFKTLLVPKGAVVRKIGVPTLVIDDLNNTFLDIDLKGIEHLNAEEYDNQLVNAQNLPRISDDKKNQILFFAVIGVFLISLFIAYKVMGIDSVVQTLKTAGGVIN